MLVFARHPEVEQVKSRLGASIGSAAARKLYRAFLRDGLAAAGECGAKVLLAHGAGPPFAEAELADTVFEQHGEGFGARLDNALAEARRRFPSGPLVVVGADTPHLAPAQLGRALAALAEAPAVMGPSGSGGFHLLGFRAELVALAACFDAPGESAAVARTLAAAGMAPRLTEFLQDVDVEQDLTSLLHELELRRQVGGVWLPAATVAAVRELGLAPGAGRTRKPR